MAKPKRKRWSCPTGDHPGVLGPGRPRANNIVRYCLPCSEKDGVIGPDATLLSVDIVPSEDNFEFKDGHWLKVVPNPETRGGTMLEEP